MSKILSNAGRPVVVFDPTDSQHRKLYAEYARTGTWKNSPVRFVASEGTQVDVGTITRQLVSYYTSREFGKTTS